MSELLKNLLMWLFIAITVFSVFNNFNTEASVQELSYSEFISQVESDQVLSVEFSSDNYTLKGKTVNGESFETVRPPFYKMISAKFLLIIELPLLVKDQKSSLFSNNF